MTPLPRQSFGAPGIYQATAPPPRALGDVRLDVAGFAGVAPRGPTAVVAVESFDEYRRLFGGFEGPGRLPYAVAAFFEQGGQRAYVVRIVPAGSPAPDAADARAAGVALDTLQPDGVATNVLTGVATTGEPTLRARDEGTWGNRLCATLTFAARPLAADVIAGGELILPDGEAVPAGTLLRLTRQDGSRVLLFVARVERRGLPDAAGYRVHAVYEMPVGGDLTDARAEVVEGVLALDDGDGRAERFGALGLSSLHPRWIASVLRDESLLVTPADNWAGSELRPGSADLPSSDQPCRFAGGWDRWRYVTPDDVIERNAIFTPEEPEDAATGVLALAEVTELSLLVVPDLYSPGPLAPVESVRDQVPAAGATFEPCLTPAEPPLPDPPTPADLEGLALDPRSPADLAAIVELQQRLVDLAERGRSFVVLLDVPPGLSQRQILTWRGRFDSSYAACYHPWLRVSRRDDLRDALVRVSPSAIAAGIIARSEAVSGVPQGPANVLAVNVACTEDQLSPARHDELHPAGVNAFLLERDGVRLTAARTLSRDPSLRQLSVRRLMLLLRRTIERQTQWAVFEPNTPSLRAELRNSLLAYLRQLGRAGAFRGATEESSFFVRCGDDLNPPRTVALGRLTFEIGVAPAEPLEFLVLRFDRDGDGALSASEKGVRA